MPTQSGVARNLNSIDPTFSLSLYIYIYIYLSLFRFCITIEKIVLCLSVTNLAARQVLGYHRSIVGNRQRIRHPTASKGPSFSNGTQNLFGLTKMIHSQRPHWQKRDPTPLASHPKTVSFLESSQKNLFHLFFFLRSAQTDISK